jgi:3-hydroxybutyryl-CoA dehydrogenase
MTETTIGVVGAGAMGSGIAQVAAAAGHTVVLADALAGATERARGAMTSALGKLVEKGKIDASARDGLLARIRFTEQPLATDVSMFAGCGLVIEAIVEDLPAKQKLLTAISAVVPGDAIVASNTSSLSIASLARACTNPGRVIGIHFFNPAPVLPLVEIVPWLGTGSSVAERARALVDSWGKTTVVAADTPGFIVNRVARPFYGEALRIHDEGIADVATIDWALKTMGGFRMGPFELMDFIGNDVNFAVTNSVFEACFWEPRYRSHKND